MRSPFKNYIFYLILIMPFSCAKKKTQQKVLVLQPNFSQIQDIVSIADCDSPFGKYTTEVHSILDGSCFFLQKFEDNDTPFIVKLDSLNNGYLVNENAVTIDTLSRLDVEMIRGHEIHKMSINPQFFFDSLVYVKQIKYLEADHQLYFGIDKLNNHVELLYNSEKKLISKIELLNSRDTTQTIEILFNKWRKSKYGDLAKEIKIIQAKKDTFYFNYKSLKIRDKTGYNNVYNPSLK